MYFFDTYAFIEIFRGNINYSNFQNTDMVTTKLNLMEVYYWLLNKFGQEVADNFYDKTLEYTTEITDEIIKKAMQFRLEKKKQNLSYTDCIGYVVAKVNNLRFLTGDMQFKELDNVEFVK